MAVISTLMAVHDGRSSLTLMAVHDSRFKFHDGNDDGQDANYSTTGMLNIMAVL